MSRFFETWHNLSLTEKPVHRIKDERKCCGKPEFGSRNQIELLNVGSEDKDKNIRYGRMTFECHDFWIILSQEPRTSHFFKIKFSIMKSKLLTSPYPVSSGTPSKKPFHFPAFSIFFMNLFLWHHKNHVSRQQKNCYRIRVWCVYKRVLHFLARFLCSFLFSSPPCFFKDTSVPEISLVHSGQCIKYFQEIQASEEGEGRRSSSPQVRKQRMLTKPIFKLNCSQDLL